MMPGLLELCKKLFKTTDLYEVLSVSKKATANEVKKGYHKLSLKVHPDRVQKKEKKLATEKFQTLGKVYCILSDKEKRALYDESGEIDEDDDTLSPDRDWYDHWRILFRQISEKDIKDFEKKYQGSEEELTDLKAMYCECEGDMGKIIDSVMCATVKDEPRFVKILEDLIKTKEVPKYPAFNRTTSKTQSTSRKRKAGEEAAEAEEHAKLLGLTVGEGSLQALIQSRQQSRKQQMDSFFSDIEAKYAELDETEQKRKSKSKSKSKSKKK